MIATHPAALFDNEAFAVPICAECTAMPRLRLPVTTRAGLSPAGLNPALVVTGSRNRGIAVHSAQIGTANASLSKSAAGCVAINEQSK